jgi:hypothetical protein
MKNINEKLLNILTQNKNSKSMSNSNSQEIELIKIK